MILGPFTLVRPIVAVAAAGWGAWRGGAFDVGVVIALGTVAVLAVEPLADRLWYDPRARLGSVTQALANRSRITCPTNEELASPP
jgi:hypothetical protein